jgi:predicted metal-dependent phosphoesterase TrpH
MDVLQGRLFEDADCMDVRRADLHTHSRCSDGKLAPAELVTKVCERGIRALAVTDHDTIDALTEAIAAGERLGVEIIPGVELSATVDEQEVHLLGYCFDPENSDLVGHLNEFRCRRQERSEQIVALLNKHGLALRVDDVLLHARDGVVGRPHIAQALVTRGFVASYEQAFAWYLKDHGPAFVPKPLFPVADALTMLHEAGGIGILAHPGSRTNGRMIRDLVRKGLDGLETVHPSHSVSLTRQFKDIARERGLIETGGSDYHGFRPHEDENINRYSIPYQRLERMRRAAA